jgi:hypothetical protein
VKTETDTSRKLLAKSPLHIVGPLQMAVTALITSVGAQLCVSVSLLLSLHPASVCPDAWPAVRAVHDWRYFFGVGGGTEV